MFICFYFTSADGSASLFSRIFFALSTSCLASSGSIPNRHSISGYWLNIYSSFFSSNAEYLDLFFLSRSFTGAQIKTIFSVISSIFAPFDKTSPKFLYVSVKSEPVFSITSVRPVMHSFSTSVSSRNFSDSSTRLAYVP